MQHRGDISIFNVRSPIRYCINWSKEYRKGRLYQQEQPVATE